VAIVTGASTGVGFDIARRLVQNRWTVIGFSRSEEKLAKARHLLGERFESYRVDIQDFDQVAAAVVRAGRDVGLVDLLVNNAARFKMASFAACTANDIDAIVDTNLKGAMYCTRCVLPLLNRPGGRIVNIASVAATHGIPGQAIYCASKFGLDGFAEALGQELSPSGVHVTTIYPGGIDTPLWNSDNPYPGDLSEALRSDDVASAVEHVANLPARVICKKVVMFPSNEWH